MKSKILILFIFAVPFVICVGKLPKKFGEEVEKINVLANNGTEINNEFLLKEDGFLGEGGFGFVYEGIMKEGNRTVAIKFVKKAHLSECQREMDMYCYLKAYKNTDVEKYGIPVVYYYGRWSNYILTALTKFDKSLLEVYSENPSLGSNPLDILNLLRDFVFQSKYMHSCGVRHDDIKPKNIMLRGERSFLIDFNMSSKMNEDNGGGTEGFSSKRYENKETRRATDDYESFLRTIRYVMQDYWPFLESNSGKKELGQNALEKIFTEFANEIAPHKFYPNYDELEKKISRKIKKIQSTGSCLPGLSLKLSWFESSPERNIKDIDEPSFIRNFTYPATVHL